MKTKMFDRYRTHIPLLCFLIYLLPGQSLVAQRAPGDVGIGVHIGQPTGLTLKIYKPTTSIDFLAAWDLNDFFFLNIHAIYDTPLNNDHTIHFFYGPGGYIGIRDRRGDLPDDVEVGVSGNFGVDFFIRKFEIFLQLTPRLALLERTDFNIGGGVGFRMYF